MIKFFRRNEASSSQKTKVPDNQSESRQVSVNIDSGHKKDFHSDRRRVKTDLLIHDLKVPGNLIAHGTNVKLTEKNNIDLRDQNGKYFVRELWQVAKTQGSGWVDYRWANADRTQFADKSSYVERVGDYFVSVGVYQVEAPNENMVGIISGNPYSAPTYLQFAYDMSIVLNDSHNLRVVPVIGMGGVQNIRDVRKLKGIDIGFTQSVRCCARSSRDKSPPVDAA